MQKNPNTVWAFSLLLAAMVLTISASFISNRVAAKGPKEKPGGGETGPQYIVIDLGSFFGEGVSEAHKINNVGGVLVRNGGRGGPAVLLEVDPMGGIQRISELPGPDDADQTTGTSDLNDDFDVVGGAVSPFALDENRTVYLKQAILWRVPETGTVEIIELDGLPINLGNERTSEATGISSSGLIVGSETELDFVNEVNVRTDVIVWQTDALGVVAKVALPNGIQGEDVNSSGIVTGVADGIGPAIWVLNFDQNGLLCGASNPIFLPGLGGPVLDVYQITDGGRIAGTALTNTGEKHAIVWTVDADGSILDLNDLGILDGYETSGTAGVNDHAETVGNAFRDRKTGRTISRESNPFFANSVGMTDLNRLIVDYGGVRSIRLALDINELGWICGQAASRSDIHGYIAIPVSSSQ